MRFGFRVGFSALIALLLPSLAYADDKSLCFNQDERAADALPACERLLKTSKGKDVGALLLWRGLHKSNAKDYQGAIADLTKSIALLPGKPETFYFRAMALLALRDLSKAIDDLVMVFKIDPQHAEGRSELISALIQVERLDDAIVRANEWLAINPNSAMASSYLGAAWYGKKDFDRALRYFDRAVALSPNDATFLNNRATAWREKGDLDKAFADYDRSIELNPKLPGTYTNRGLAWRAREDLDRAVEDFEKAVALDPDNPDPRTCLGLAHEAKGELEKATNDYRSAGGRPNRSLYSERYKAIAKARIEVLSSIPSDKASMEQQRRNSNENDRRIALVIGNGKYAHAGSLANPPNDGHLIADALRNMGFAVSAGYDLDQPLMKRTIEEFLATATGAKIAVVFYAGHGIQVDGKNYLVPIDFRAHAGIDVPNELIDVDFILSGLDDRIRTNVIILDACRDNPLAGQMADSAPGRSVTVRSGLANPSGLGSGAALGAGTLLAFATAPGQVALDGEGQNSPFSGALGRHISTPGVELQQMLTRVRAEVVAATKSRQVPWSNSSLLGEVYLAR